MTHLADQLHDFIQIVLLLQNFSDHLPGVQELRIKFVIELFQRLGVLGVGDEPIY